MSWGQIINGAKQFPLHAGQADIMRSNARFRAAIAGTGGGKTALGPVWCMQQIERVRASRNTRKEPIVGLVVAPTYKILSRTTTPMLVRSFQDTYFEGVYKQSSGIYELPDCNIFMVSSDSPDHLEGGQYDFAWLDEAGQMKYGAWIAVQARVGLRQAPVLMTTTPYQLNWLYHEFYKRYEEHDANYYVRQWASFSNPAYSKEEYDRAKSVMSAHRGAMRYDGLFMKAEGLVYPDFESCVTDVPASDLVGAPGRHYGGMDFGWNDPAASLVGLLDDEDVLWIWYERYKRESGIAETARAIPLGVEKWWADPARPDSIHELRKADHVVVGAAMRNIISGVDAVNARIYSNRLKVCKNCQALISEASSYAYPSKDDKSVGENPIDADNHAMDALRYLITGIDHGRMAA